LNLKDKLINSFENLVQSSNGSEAEHVGTKRTESMAVFTAQGFPSMKDEEWKYTPLNKSIKRDYQLESQFSTDVKSSEVDSFLCSGIDSYKLVFVNGVFSSALSNTTSQENFFVTNLKDAFSGDSEIFNEYFGKLADTQQSMVALNTAFAKEGAFIYVKAGSVVDKLIQIIYINNDNSEAQLSQVRNLFVVEDRAEVQILERHQSLTDEYVFTNVVTETSVGNEAHFKHFKVQNNLDQTTLVDSTFVQQGAKSSSLVDTFAFGGDLTRNNLHFEFSGEYAEANMDAITLLKGDTIVDHHTFVDHAVPNCQSNQLYKGIYDEKSKGVFNGKVMVRKDAQKTNAFQQNNNLLLTDLAAIDTKPQLEIFADDVACSHGCTIGQLDDEALFYMQSRGIPIKEAKAFLMFAFAGDTLKNITIPELKAQLINLVAQKLNVNLELNELKI
jgi:Fe-S cluster assembly protein SufD